MRDSVDVKLYEESGELYVLAKSQGRQAKKTAIRPKRLARLLRRLRVIRRSLPARDQILMRIGAANKDAGRAFSFVKIRIPGKRPSRHQAELLFSSGQGQTEQGGTTGWTLSAAQQPDRRRSSGVVVSVCTTHPDRSGVSLLEKRIGNSSDLSSARASRRGSHPDRFSCLLSSSHAKKSLDDQSPGLNSASKPLPPRSFVVKTYGPTLTDFKGLSRL
jgi:hypothetical protein